MNLQSSSSIKLAASAEEIERCFPVMVQLRSHLKLDDFVQQVQQLISEGYQLAYLSEQDVVIGLAGFRLTTSLSWGKHMYVADLIVDQNRRSQGYGQELFTWLIQYAKKHHCQQLHLDSGVQRFAAHRFYLRQKMDIVGHHLAIELS